MQQRYTHLLVLDFEVMTYTIDKQTDVLDVDSTTSSETNLLSVTFKNDLTQVFQH